VQKHVHPKSKVNFRVPIVYRVCGIENRQIPQESMNSFVRDTLAPKSYSKARGHPLARGLLSISPSRAGVRCHAAHLPLLMAVVRVALHCAVVLREAG
jgi:hypothetical protein